MEALITEAEKSICVSVVARECCAFITLLVISCEVFFSQRTSTSSQLHSQRFSA